ncbi:helicase ARIP4-like [Aplochiton taeniatus]
MLFSFTDQPQSASFSSENEAQGGDSAGQQCTSPVSTNPSRKTSSRPHPTLHSQSTSTSMTSPKKRASKPAHMRRNISKLLREHQLEAVTKAVQQDELERRRRLESHRNDIHVPLLPEYKAGGVSQKGSAAADRQNVIHSDYSTSCASISENNTSALVPATCTHKIEVGIRSIGEEEYRSGAHVNDALNQRDAQGRVLVNLNHPEKEADLYLSPQLARAVKPHQIGGIRFLYDNLVESLERFEISTGFGCILAHSMGLGKTLEVISFIDILLKHTQAHTVLAIVPVNTLQNWLSEFNLWIPASEALPPDTDPALVTPRSFKVHILNDEHKTTSTRAKVVEDWARDGGVLLMGYEMYRLLSLKKSFVAGRKKKKSKKPAGPVVIDLDEEDRQQELLKVIERALSQPGPDVVICDEGHRIKNCHASTSQALKNIQTRRRVVLTGYPLQNNLIEYWCMVDFVRPDFLGSRQEFSNMFERPILNGQCVDSTPQDVQLMRYRSHVLHSLLEGFIQRRGHDVLRDQLPTKQEHVILVRLSPLQRALYTEFMNRFREAGNSGWLSLNPLKAFCVCCKIWNHPDVLYETIQKENVTNEQDLDLDDITSTGPSRGTVSNRKDKSTENPNAIGGLSLMALQEKANQVISYEWAKDVMLEYKTGVLENSAKMVLLFHLIEECVKTGDKILVFSQSLSTLTVIEEFLAKRPVPACPNSSSSQQGHNQNWVRNHNYYRLDGSTSASERERLINQFNDPCNTNTHVFLLSTRAGCLGVNLIGANRVVVFDASWNPCHDAQAVCRVYRYGQRKPCYIYRLVCDFTLEKKIYDRQISKQSMSDRVVDDMNPVLSFTRREVESLLHFVEEEPDVSEVQLQPQDHIETVIRKACLLYPHLITKQPFHHESLLLDWRELKLTNAEKKAAKKSYEDEKRASVPYTRPSYAHYYPASDQSLSNIPAFSQRNWRPPPQVEEKPVSSVWPTHATPVPLVPRQGPAGSTPTNKLSESNLTDFPVNYLQKAGVFVQKIVTTTDIVIPGTNSSKDVQARISAGKSIHVIRGSKGTYIRACDGRIFAIRAAGKNKSGEENSAARFTDSQKPTDEVTTKGSNSCVSPDRTRTLSSKDTTRPLSTDCPEILSELQQNAVAAETKMNKTVPAESWSQQERAHETITPTSINTLGDTANTNGSHGILTSCKVKTNSLHVMPQDDHSPPTSTGLPNIYSATTQDQKTGPKRKAPAPLMEEKPSKQLVLRKHTSANPPQQGFPFPSGYGLPPFGLNHQAMLGSLEQPLFVGAGSSYFQLPHGQLGDPCLMFPITPDPFGLGGVPNSSSTTTTTATTAISSASSLAVTGAESVPPFMLSPRMAGMLPPGSPLPYSRSLASLYPGPLLSGGLPSPAATPGPAGASFLSHDQPSACSSSSSSSPSSSSNSPSAWAARPDRHQGLVPVQSGSTSDNDNDVVSDDRLQVMGE